MCLPRMVVLTSRKATRTERSPATATGDISCLSEWKGLRVRVPLPRWTRPWASLTMNRLFWSFAWYWASCLSTAASLALLVPAPSRPRPKMAL